MLLAERAEGIASVAHALAYCHAIERIAGCGAPAPPALVRVLHAELERLACHLDVAVRLADAAGLAVATARFGWHKERVLRLVGQLCGQPVRPRRRRARRGRRAARWSRPAICWPRSAELDKAVSADGGLLMGTSSFLDRLRRTGPLRPDRAARARRARPDRAGVGLSPTTPGSPALRRLRAALGLRGQRRVRTATRWPG